MNTEHASDELTDTAALASVFQRQLDCSSMARQIAQQLYAARTAWIGGGMDWKDLTPQQQKTYRDEACTLITGPQTAPESLPHPDRGALVAQGYINPLPVCIKDDSCQCQWHQDQRFISGDQWPPEVRKARAIAQADGDSREFDGNHEDKEQQ